MSKNVCFLLNDEKLKTKIRVFSIARDIYSAAR